MLLRSLGLLYFQTANTVSMTLTVFLTCCEILIHVYKQADLNDLPIAPGP